MWTRNGLDLQTVGSQLVMPKNLPDHWGGNFAEHFFVKPKWHLTSVDDGFNIEHWW